MDFLMMTNLMMQLLFMKFAFNDLPHALGLIEPFDTDASKIEPEVDVTIRRPAYAGMSDPASIEEGLKQSMREEQTAIAKYRTRAAHARLNGDEETARVFEHVAEEEDQHYREFGRRWAEKLRGQIGASAAVIP